MTDLVARLALLVLLFGSVCAAADPKDPKCCPVIKLEVEPRWAQEGTASLAITLTNVGQQPIRFSKGNGPWLGLHQIQMVAVTLATGEPIENKLMAAMDPQMGYMVLEPGQSKQHVVEVAHLYPELDRELRKGKDIIVLFWTYQLTTSDGQKSQRVGGWLEFPAKRHESK